MIVKRRLFSHFSLLKNTKRLCGKSITEQNDTIKPFESIPGPAPLPIVGNIWRFLPFSGDYYNLQFHEMMSKFQKQYGNIVLIRGLKMRDDILYIFDPKDIETIYRNDGSYPKRNSIEILSHYRDIRPEIFGSCRGLFCLDGKEWHQLRSKLNQIFLKPAVTNNYAVSVSYVVDDFIKTIRNNVEASPNGGKVKDLKLELSKLALETITFLGTNMRIGFFTNEAHPKAEKYIKVNLHFFKMLFDFEFTPTLWKHFPTPRYRKAIRIMDSMSEFVLEFMESFQNTARETGKNPPPLLEEVAKHGKDILNATAIDLLVGGVDTTQRALAELLYYLAVNPQVQNKLRDEVMTQMPNLSTPITSEVASKYPFLRVVIKEVLRLMPIVPANVRFTQKDTVLSGYHVPKDTVVVLGHFVPLHENKHFAEANKLVPERWLRSSKSNRSSERQWSYAPFGFGPRSCIGQRLAMLEMEIFLIKMIRNFKLEWRQEEEMKFTSHLLTGMAAPLDITFVPIEK